MRRLTTGGVIDRTAPLSFTWDGRPLVGFAGDTLASALLAAGVDVLGTSVTQGRPRGVMSAGLEEATAFVQLTSADGSEPLQRATTIPLYEGLAADGRLVRGALDAGAERGRFDKRYAHCDVLVVGGGAAGLAATLVAARAGGRVILAERDQALGGALLREGGTIDGLPALAWVQATEAELRRTADVRLLLNSSVEMLVDQEGAIITERIGAVRSATARAGLPQQRLWQLRTQAIVLATGALERPIVFPDNDRPGILLAGAARTYLRRFSLAPTRGVVFTTHDDGWRTALDWHDAGVTVAAVVDVRSRVTVALVRELQQRGVPCRLGATVVGTDADATGRLAAVHVRHGEAVHRLDCDCLAVSGGWEPALGLHLQLGGTSRFDATRGAALPAGETPGRWVAGSANGTLTLGDTLADGARAARAALAWCRIPASNVPEPVASNEPIDADSPSGAADSRQAPLWYVAAPDGDESRSFVDLHRDVTMAGVARAVAAGAHHIEHVKRYTLAGTGVEQGRSAKANAAAATATHTGRALAEVGVSGGRPPSEPITFAALAGRALGARYEPVRTSSLCERHVALGAEWEVTGSWLRPARYPRAGEREADTVAREQRAARGGVALFDASTLGKLDVQGPDAAWFLDQLYINHVASLRVGRARYSALCGMDGALLDDGLILRLAESRFLVTTSSGHVQGVTEWMEEWLQTEWPSRRVWVTPVTEHWATVAVVGPQARTLLARVADGIDLTRAAFPFHAVRWGTVAQISDALVARVSFTGELSFEVSVPWPDAPALWDALMAAGAELAVTPIGLDALQALRIEKGHLIVGQDTEALTTPVDAGLGWLMAPDKDFVGRRSMERPALRRSDRPQLVAFAADDAPEGSNGGDPVVLEGMALVSGGASSAPRTEGHVTSACRSATLGRSLGLALVRGGHARIGERLDATWGDAGRVAVTLVERAQYDPAGARRDG